MAILKFKDENGNFVDIPVIEGKPGKQGEPGPQGQDGKTPVRGDDFWTEEDIKAIEGHCDNYIDKRLGLINEELASLTTLGGE